MKQREITFRVWNKVYCEMFYSKNFFRKNDGYIEKLYITLDGKLRGDFKYCGDVDCSEEYIMQQYTGFKDKNGVDIYEGDIVKFDDSLIAQKPMNGLAEVIYTTDMTLVSSPCFGLRFIGDKSGFYPSMLGEIEVVGNIFENPELLKQ